MKNILRSKSTDVVQGERSDRKFVLLIAAVGIVIIIIALVLWNSSIGSSTVFEALVLSASFAIFGLSFIAIYRRSVEERHRKLEEARRKLEAAIADLTAEKNRSDRYFDFLAHDMANLLAPLMSYGVMISSHPTAPGEIRRYSRKIVDQTDKAAKFITNMRRLMEAEAVSQVTPPAYDISSNLKALENKLKKENAKKRISFKANAPENQRVLVAGGEFAEEIIFSILSNSAKHTKADEARIAVMISPLEEAGRAFWRISIEDEGTGIPDARKASIANPFETSQKFSRGTGSTISFMSAIARHFGGRLSIEDRIRGDPTKGTRVVVILPSVGPAQSN